MAHHVELSYGLKFKDLGSDVQAYLSFAGQIEKEHQAVVCKYAVDPGTFNFLMSSWDEDSLEKAVHSCLTKFGDPGYADKSGLEFISRAKGRFNEND